jgi:hypothetical protein
MNIAKATTDLNEESYFDPVTCSLDDLIEAVGRHEEQGNRERAAFLLGVWHCRVFIRAATNGRIF